MGRGNRAATVGAEAKAGALPADRAAAPAPVALAVRLSEIALAVAIGLLLARLTWTVLAPSSVAPPSDLTGGGGGASGARAGGYNALLLSSFNPYAPPAADGEAAPQEAEIALSDLNITCRGSRRGSDPGSGNAYLQTPGQPQDRYFIGDEVLPGVTVADVFNDRVEISRNGLTEFIPCGFRGAGASLIRPAGEQNLEPVAVELAPALGGAQPQERGPAEPQGQTDAASAAPALVAREPLTEYDLTLLARALRPARDGERVSGYTITSAGAGALDKMGLEPGDLVVGVNGVDVTDPNNLMALGEELAAAGLGGGLALDIERDGVRMGVTATVEAAE